MGIEPGPELRRLHEAILAGGAVPLGGRPIGDRREKVAAAGLGQARRPDLADAIACYGRAADLYRRLGDRRKEAETLVRLGDAHVAAGQRDSARNAWEQARLLVDVRHADVAPLRPRRIASARLG